MCFIKQNAAKKVGVSGDTSPRILNLIVECLASRYDRFNPVEIPRDTPLAGQMSAPQGRSGPYGGQEKSFVPSGN
jgi:hypothetical protein